MRGCIVFGKINRCDEKLVAMTFKNDHNYNLQLKDSELDLFLYGHLQTVSSSCNLLILIRRNQTGSHILTFAWTIVVDHLQAIQLLFEIFQDQARSV